MTTLPFMLTTSGTWDQLESDPLAPFSHLDDWDEQVKSAGYYKWGGLGTQDDIPLWLEIYRVHTDKEGSAPCFLVVLSNSGHFEVLYAESAPALMELQSRWAPAIQAAAVTDLLGRLDDSSSKYGFAGLVRKALQ
ncbi:hypothetical protein [Streptomyces subrutilus]|uniref:Uncharacterized protein n=1 Tax=Streptomyces subrutilus TaxID=36818 RepID=A0A1E5P0E7_9ACTN|nr:hypothetical protein [Streptomyces subrutilus]OEJ22471.1 hypothetical protein BGK67_33610 [Streptomyces subrutilus]